MDEPAASSHNHHEGNQFRPEEAIVVAPDAVAAVPQANNHMHAPEPITWTASEFIESQKPANWYILLGAGALCTAFVVWLFTRDFFPSIAVLMGVVLLGVYGARRPREEHYSLDDRGIAIGTRHYSYLEFRTFKLMPDGAFMSIELVPLKRFAMAITLFFDPADEDRIIEKLAEHLPMEEGALSLTDDVMRRIRF